MHAACHTHSCRTGGPREINRLLLLWSSPFYKMGSVIGNTRGKVPQSFSNHAVSLSHRPTDSAPVDNVWGLMKNIDNSLSEGPLNLLHYVVLGRKEVITKVVLTSDSLHIYFSLSAKTTSVEVIPVDCTLLCLIQCFKALTNTTCSFLSHLHCFALHYIINGAWTTSLLQLSGGQAYSLNKYIVIYETLPRCGINNLTSICNM